MQVWVLTNSTDLGTQKRTKREISKGNRKEESLTTSLRENQM